MFIDLIDTPNATIPERAARQLGSVDSKIFTASSIFCLFQETRIAESLRMHLPEGVELGKKETDILAAFKAQISNYFDALQSTQRVKGAPNVDNPFVLGYSISQKLPDVRDFDFRLRARILLSTFNLNSGA